MPHPAPTIEWTLRIKTEPVAQLQDPATVNLPCNGMDGFAGYAWKQAGFTTAKDILDKLADPSWDPTALKGISTKRMEATREALKPWLSAGPVEDWISPGSFLEAKLAHEKAHRDFRDIVGLSRVRDAIVPGGIVFDDRIIYDDRGPLWRIRWNVFHDRGSITGRLQAKDLHFHQIRELQSLDDDSFVECIDDSASETTEPVAEQAAE